ncbi:beta-propeller fold lactonase family protein [Sphingomonas quercus]|uniref:YncE family protein n=1 Tax=Sphingomonas quercus TaxID=2842451 RepID=A0ABS6BKB1_9SPHN|nr:beta-propeller fold lactonase family protein [Sphingomonas quercus]MBU3078604.1 hypothetical protein [Sphingomonas quercus]
MAQLSMTRAALAAAVALGLAIPAGAETVLVALDGKQVRAGDTQTGPTADAVAVLDIGTRPPRVLGMVETPATLNGPPVSIAVSRDGKFALVANPQKLGPDNKTQPDGVVSLISLADPAHPRVLQRLAVAPGAMGVWLNRRGDLALVACANDDSIAVLAVRGGTTLEQVGTVKLEAKAEPRDVVMTPDGRSAYAVRFGDGKLTRLAIKGNSVTRDGDIAVGVNPDGAIISADGRYLYNSNFGGTPLNTPKTGAVSIVDLKAGRMIGAVDVGATPEHVVLSPDGRYLAVVVGNGSAFVRTAENFSTVLGKLKLFRTGGGTLVPVAEADTSHNCQGATFSADGRTILVECAVERDITSYAFDGKTLTRAAEPPLVFESRPGAFGSSRGR